MNEDQTTPAPEPATPAPTHPELPSPVGGYSSFHEKPVFVQLKVEMVGVTYPNSPVLDDSGNPLGTKMLRGMCIVHPLEQIIELRSADPLYPQLMAITLIPRELIAYITRIEPMPSPSGYNR